MNRNNTWRFIIVLSAVLWSVYEFYPPSLWGGGLLGRDVLEEFETQAVKPDETFNAILAGAKARQATNSVRTYGNLRDAIGTNDISRYFPFYSVTNEQRPTEAILNRLQREGAGQIRLGLDLQGGTSFLVEMNTNALVAVEGDTNAPAPAQELKAVLSEAVEVLRKRVDKFGVAEPIIQPAGADRILIQLPGLSEEAREEAKTQIQKAAYLEFRMVHPQSDELLAQGLTEPGYEVLKRKERHPDGSQSVEAVLVKKRPEHGLNGSYVRRAIVTRGNLGEPEINFELDSKGAEIFAEVTRENIGRRLAIVLDGELYSAPVIRGEIPGGRGQITGRFDLKEAQELANVLENPLRAPLRIIESRDVDPTLGKDSITSGLKASIYGILAVAAFMLVYYMLSGMVANVALITNVIILLGVMCYFRTTFTLPGIAGIVLTVGMAVDANVLIYERIREEQGKGKSLRGAIDAGYDRAFGTIFDSHVTTLISSIILIWLGTGSVKGFGVALTIGVAASLFTALVVTRLIFDFMLARNWIKSLKMLHLVPTTLKLDFMKLALPAFVVSWAIILIGNGYGLFVRGKDVLGVEFVGGYSISLGFDKKAKDSGFISVDHVRRVVDELKKGASQVSFQRDPSSGLETLAINIRNVGTEKSGEDAGKQVVAKLKETYPTAAFSEKKLDKIGPTVGAEMQRIAIFASVLAMFGILVYVAFRYEFSFAVGAVVAIIHDILMTLGCYFLTGLFGEGRELNATTVAALLTIIGFSINDTVVIFDRIREDLKLGVRGSFREIMNAALNQTLSRTIITSGTVFLATFSLYLFGGGPINDFAFCFLVGILTGTYSSIYIASALVLWWHKGQRPKIGAAVATVDNPMVEKAQA
jgi:SecD/SecF fusion protein